MSDQMMEKLRELSEKATVEPWDFCILDMPLSQVGAYVQKCTDASPGDDYFFVSGTHDDGNPADICHVGNGPRSGANAEFIVACVNYVRAVLAEAAKRAGEGCTK